MYQTRDIRVDGLDYICEIEIQGNYSPAGLYEPPTYPEIEVISFTPDFEDDVKNNPIWPKNYFDEELTKQRLAEAIYWDMRRKGEFL